MHALRIPLFTGAMVAVFTSINTFGSLVHYAGVVTDNAGNEITEWRTPGTAKTMDTTPDGIYGSDGYDLFFRGNNLPAHGISFLSLGPGIRQAGPSTLYASVDDPLNPGSDLSLATTTGTSTTPGAGVLQATVITYQFTNASLYPNGLRLGIWTDGLDGVRFSSEEIYVSTTGVGGGLAQVDTTPRNNNIMDAYFFNITQISNGDQFSLAVDVPPDGNWPTLQAITVDALTAVPEPSSALLILLGFCTLRFGLAGHRYA